MNITIDTDLMDLPEVGDYLANADRRVRIGARFILELYGIALPESLVPGVPGRRIKAKDIARNNNRWAGPGRRPVEYQPPAEARSVTNPDKLWAKG